MDALVVYESIYGNTRAIAEAIADGVGGAAALPVHVAVDHPEPVDLLVVGGPTHMHGLTTARSRRAAAEGAAEDGASHVEPGAGEEVGLRSWLRDLSPAAAHRTAAFDTRLDRSPWLTGTAARGIAKRMRSHGLDVVAIESFIVEDAEGPLLEGEVERARAWGADLARIVSRSSGEAVEVSR